MEHACCASIQHAAATLASLLCECFCIHACLHLPVRMCTLQCCRCVQSGLVQAFHWVHAAQQRLQQVCVFTTRRLKHSSLAVSWTTHPRSILLWSSLYSKFGLCMYTASTCRQACSCDYPAMLLTTCKHSLGVSLSAWLVTSCTTAEV